MNTYVTKFWFSSVNNELGAKERRKHDYAIRVTEQNMEQAFAIAKDNFKERFPGHNFSCDVGRLIKHGIN